MSDEMKDVSSLSLIEINAEVKRALKSEFGADVGFKTIDKQTAISYVVQVAVQRVKQRTRGKEERELFKKYKEEFKKRGIKV
jgi:hypothetical protein